MNGGCNASCYRGIGWCANSHLFGKKIALSGEYAVVWSWHSYSREFEYDYDPMLYVFRLIDDVWTLESPIWPDTNVGGIDWGNTLAIDGHSIVTGTGVVENSVLVLSRLTVNGSRASA